MSVTYQKLAARLQARLDTDKNIPDVTQAQLVTMMRGVFALIGDALSNGEDIYLEGFGRFHPDCKAPRKIKSGVTGETHTTDYKVFVKFTPFKQLNTQVQQFMAKIGFIPPTEDNMLPHLRDKFKQEPEEPFETMDREMAKVYNATHPDADPESSPFLPAREMPNNKDAEKDAEKESS